MTRRLHITDHALLRHLERVQGVDLAAARREIHNATKLAHDYPDATGVISGPVTYKIKGDAIVDCAASATTRRCKA